MGIIPEALPAAEEARELLRSGRNMQAKAKQISGTARGYRFPKRCQRQKKRGNYCAAVEICKRKRSRFREPQEGTASRSAASGRYSKRKRADFKVSSFCFSRLSSLYLWFWISFLWEALSLIRENYSSCRQLILQDTCKDLTWAAHSLLRQHPLWTCQGKMR